MSGGIGDGRSRRVGKLVDGTIALPRRRPILISFLILPPVPTTSGLVRRLVSPCLLPWWEDDDDWF